MTTAPTSCHVAKLRRSRIPSPPGWFHDGSAVGGVIGAAGRSAGGAGADGGGHVGGDVIGLGAD